MSSLVPHLRGDHLIIGKSTVPPGTAAELQSMIDGMLEPGQVALRSRGTGIPAGRMCGRGHASPGPYRGRGRERWAAETVQEIYRPLTDVGVPLLLTDLATSELAKGAANAFLATKISFINAMADICAADRRRHLRSGSIAGPGPPYREGVPQGGIGYGGACLPKDVRGLGAFAREVGAETRHRCSGAMDGINASRSGQAVEPGPGGHWRGHGGQAGGGLGSRVQGRHRRCARLGWTAGRGPFVFARRQVTVYDPMGSGNALVTYPEFTYADSAITAAADADVIVIVTAWPEFAQLDAAEVAESSAARSSWTRARASTSPRGAMRAGRSLR